MENKYEYGPDIEFSITTVGEMYRHNGSYENLSEKSKYLLQAICHMVYQIKEELPDDVDTIQIDDVLLMKIKNQYALYTSSMMTIFNIIETGKYTYEVEFLSPAQFVYADTFIDYACAHAFERGKAK